MHRAALQFSKLSEEAFAGLTRAIIREDGTVRLTTPIDITEYGAIVDGRHRARVLVEAGHGDKLTRQIEAGGGEWVMRIPKGIDPYVHAVRSQSTRRNLPAWQMALAILSRYRAAVAAGEAQRGKKGKDPGELSPAAAFCKSVAISRTVFHQVDRLDRRASTEDMKALRAGKIRLSELERRLSAADEVSRSVSPTDTQASGSMGADLGSRNGHRSHHHADDSLPQSGRIKSSSTKGNERSRSGGFEQAVNLLNKLLQPHDRDVSETADVARSLLASIDEGPRQRIIDAVALAGARTSVVNAAAD